MKKEKILTNNWLKSIENLERAKPSDKLFNKISDELFVAKIIPMKQMLMIAASILLLIATNIVALKNYNSSKPIYSQSSEILTDYQIYNNEK